MNVTVDTSVGKESNIAIELHKNDRRDVWLKLSDSYGRTYVVMLEISHDFSTGNDEVQVNVSKCGPAGEWQARSRLCVGPLVADASNVSGVWFEFHGADDGKMP